MDVLEATVDKFTFRVPADRAYTADGLWVQASDAPGARVRVGVTDFLQQHSGDVAFAGTLPAGSRVAFGDEFATVETIKATVELPSPVDGVVVEVNPALRAAPEVVNQDPYGDGWMAVLEVADWPAQRARLLDPPAYFAHMKRLAEEEVTGP